MAQIDPLADLKAEIAAEAAAEAAKQPEPDPVIEETKAEEAKLAEAEEEQAKIAEVEANKAEAEPKKKGKKEIPPEERMVPVERMNEYAVRVRQLEREKDELEKKLNPPPPEPPKPVRTEDQIRAEARTQARLEIQLEAFSAEGNAKYGQKQFDAGCDKIAKLIGGPSNLVAVAIEATGTPKDAATAINALYQMDAPEITAFLALSPIRQAAQLAKWATARPKRTAAEDDEPKPRRRQLEAEDEELQPIRPIQGANAVSESLGDDVPMDLWVERFDKQILNKGKLAH